MENSMIADIAVDRKEDLLKFIEDKRAAESGKFFPPAKIYRVEAVTPYEVVQGQLLVSHDTEEVVDVVSLSGEIYTPAGSDSYIEGELSFEDLFAGGLTLYIE